MQISLLLAILSFCTFTFTRIFLLCYTGLVDVPLTLWPMVIVKGLFFDLATLAYLLPLFLIIDALLPGRVRKIHWLHMLRVILLSLVIFFLLLLGATEFTFWLEFHTRFNFIALDYLIYTNEVFRNIWESYPIVWILGSLAIISILLAKFLSNRFLSKISNAPSKQKRIGLLFAAVILPILSAKFVHIEMMYQEGNAFAEEISGNGLFTLAAAARHNELDYDKFYATIPQDKANHILHDLGVEWTDDLNRQKNDKWGDDANDHKLPPFLLRRPRHIILISVESLSAKFLGAYGSTDELTPQLDQLSKEGLMFPNVFATGTRTVRGLEALSLATPPIPGQAIIRRINNAHLASMGEMLHQQNFESMFFYGGNGFFDNMKEFFEANNYIVRDKPTFKKENISFENAWGMSDEDLYNNTIQTLNQTFASKKKMFAHVMTTSNHRPYTYPDGRIKIPSPGGRKGAIMYTDYAIGKFIEDAKKTPWFEDTLFVIVADHCAAVAGRTTLPVADYRIPLIFYGPKIIKPGRIERMVSQIDIAPTLLDILGVAGDDNLFGKEIQEQEGPARAFISNYQNLGYYKNNQLIVLKPKQIVEGYQVDPLTFESTPIKPDPLLVDEAIAYYQTASNAFKQGKLELRWKK